MNKINEGIYDLIEMHYLKEFTRNLGKIEILDDRINCYLDNDKLQKKIKETKYLSVGNYCIGKIENKLKNINKPIYFIIENFEFEYKIEIEIIGDKNFIEFRNCKFYNGFFSKYSKNLIFKDSYFMNHVSVIFNRTRYNFGDEANNVEFINSYFYFIYNEMEPLTTQVCLTINAKNLKFINSKFQNKNPNTRIWFDSENTEIINSKLNGGFIKINTDYLKRKNSKLDFKEVILEVKNNNSSMLYFGDIESSSIIYNGMDIAKNDKNKHEILEDKEHSFSKVKKIY